MKIGIWYKYIILFSLQDWLFVAKKKAFLNLQQYGTCTILMVSYGINTKVLLHQTYLLWPHLAVKTSAVSLWGKLELDSFMNLGKIKGLHLEQQILAKIRVSSSQNSTEIKKKVGKLQRKFLHINHLLDMKFL